MAQVIHTPPLLFEAGDRLTRDEFLEMWECMPALKFAELIDGVVYLPSPLSLKHSRKDHLVQLWTGLYAPRTGFVEVLPNATWLMEKNSAPQPDVALRIRPEYGGQSRDEDELGAGAPEFVAEVTHSSRSYDLGPKLQLYERAGVKEYLAVLMKERKLEWRVRREGGFRLILPDTTGVYRSEVFPGLWLDEPAFWNHDVPAVLATLEKGLQSPEFAAFRENRLNLH
jgi:Putative restriction endonuclease